MNSKFKVSLQKSLVVLVVAMLLAIPNMQVYSFIGSYQTSSQAIKANNRYPLQNRMVEKPIFPVYAFYGLAAIVGLGSVVAGAVFIAKAIQASQATSKGQQMIQTKVAIAINSQQTIDSQQTTIGGDSSSISNYKNHVAHDFSKFDN